VSKSTRSSVLAVSAGLFAALLTPLATGHHSANVTYDTDRTIEVSGAVTDIVWRNPHVRFSLAPSDGGPAWDIESNSVSILQRMGVTPERIKAGDTVTVAGAPARSGAREIFASNLLLADAVEMLLEPGATARWTGTTLGSDAVWTSEQSAGQTDSTRPNGIFGVWSTTLTNPESFPLFPERDTNYPLTPAAQDHVVAWQSIEDNPYFTCTPMGMPRVMGQPYPIEFIDRGTEIHLRIELHDLERTIAMTEPPDRPSERTALGSSRGRWDGQTLRVTTDQVSWPYFNQSGVPQSEQSVITESFTPSEDGMRLHYELTVDDPETFTSPVTLRKYWHWRAGEQVLPFDCTE
jgi:hypothetical protein